MISGKKLIGIVFLLVVALVSATVVRGYASSVESNAAIFETLDEKRANATGLLAASASAAAVISAIPGDAGGPIADKLMDLSACFLFILAMLYLEKYLLIILGTVVFGVVVPVTCGISAVKVFIPQLAWLKKWAVRITLCALIVYCMIPLGVWMSDSIDATYQETLNQMIDSAAETEALLSEEDDAETEEEEQGLWSRISGAVTGLVDDAKNAVTGALTWAKETLSRFVEAIAVMLVTTCIIPLLPVVVGCFAIKWILGIDIKPTSPVKWLRGKKSTQETLPAADDTSN